MSEPTISHSAEAAEALTAAWGDLNTALQTVRTAHMHEVGDLMETLEMRRQSFDAVHAKWKTIYALKS